MGESGSRRSTLVSRLPIFRRSSSKRQDSLPSSPSSGGVGNGVHSASPSSTNSSSSSTGKRRSLFRAPSLSFKRSSEPRPQPPLGSPAPEGAAPETDANGNQSQQQAQDGIRTKTRHSFGFGVHRHKKITRSQTEDFDKASSGSSSNRNNVFINCISSGTNEGDDSGFQDDYSASKRSKKKQLLPKSFSAHQRFSRNPEPCRPPEVSVAPPTQGSTPGSWAGELLGAGSSLQSPILSEDRTTAVTPSEFIPITEDSVSEADALPAPSPSPGLAPVLSPAPASPPPPAETLSQVVSSSQAFFTPAQSAVEKATLPDAANNTDYETAVSLSEPDTETPCPRPPPQQSQEEREERREERREARDDVEEGEGGGEGGGEGEGERVADGARGAQAETSESEGGGPTRSGECHSNPEQSDRRYKNILSVQEAGRGGPCCGRHEPRSSHLRKPHTGRQTAGVRGHTGS
ncbi:LOW QUALITY PROTEIN: serine-rich coiled-coil domain-containing protein 1 [Osmerus mordax]|uniref:LOW QUALITY PROTEIN: serine-rich coiled-coil domain-containing protein 1 n=1 Tax=Osmerus mordax TaxID=8014 RepID=UPI00350ED913